MSLEELEYESLQLQREAAYYSAASRFGPMNEQQRLVAQGMSRVLYERARAALPMPYELVRYRLLDGTCPQCLEPIFRLDPRQSIWDFLCPCGFCFGGKL